MTNERYSGRRHASRKGVQYSKINGIKDTGEKGLVENQTLVQRGETPSEKERKEGVLSGFVVI